jgi:predicted enzyme related to lactoylglutathione lyase
MEDRMKVTARLLIGACAALLMVTGVAQAQVTLNSARVGAEDVAALEKFYMSAFGLQEVNRLPIGPNIEVMLNFGSDVAAAKANPAAQIVIMHRDSDALKDSVPHIIFNVTDINATVAKIKAAGGKMEREPFAFGNGGMMIGIAVDPAGNQIELIQQAKK